jgi:hypothetical protein
MFLSLTAAAAWRCAHSRPPRMRVSLGTIQKMLSLLAGEGVEILELVV